MGDLWIPGAERRQRHSGNPMVGGPPRVTHHITWDQLHPDGTRLITLSGVTDYLLGKKYEPQLVIDPLTGQLIQCLPANVGAYALTHPSGTPETNRMGSVNIQIEWFFTPGTVFNGRRYGSLLDTPMLGLGAVMPLAHSWGVPDVALDAGRNLDNWLHRAGHFGHQNVPYNNHTDPQCSIAGILAKAGQPGPTPTPQPQEEPDVALTSTQVDPGQDENICLPLIGTTTYVSKATINVESDGADCEVQIGGRNPDGSPASRIVHKGVLRGRRYADVKPGDSFLWVNNLPTSRKTVGVLVEAK